MDKKEAFLKSLYLKWKEASIPHASSHPDDETLACFLEEKLPAQETERIKEHLLACKDCAELVILQLETPPGELLEPPREMIEQAKALLSDEEERPVLEVCLQLKEKTWEIIKVTGDILFGQELVPAPVLRSRNIKDIKDEITIFKDFQDITAHLKIVSKKKDTFTLSVLIKDKATQKAAKDLRVSLIKDDTELESYVAESRTVTFENILLGRYTVEIADLDKKAASILLDLRI